MKKICFILPEISTHPVGGYKIVFEYANRLVNDDFDVSILFLNELALKRFHVPQKIKNIFENYRTLKEPKWFDLDSRVKKISSTQKHFEVKLQDIDIAIATAVETVPITNRLFNNSRKFYFIQGLENWNLTTNELYKTYNMGLTNIVISKWLKRIVDEHSDKAAVYIKNPINTDQYRLITPVTQRSSLVIGMLNHKSVFKGSKDGFKALTLVRKKFPELKAIVFGTVQPPHNLPEWIEYHHNASTADTISIYNKISIFVNPSIKEGFGLTGLEAMACGAALVSTDYAGVREYAQNNRNALLSSVKDPYALAKNIETLIIDKKKREKLALQGHRDAKDFSWEVAYRKFKQTILR